ncbi:MAG TPA: hypothetical protein VKX17_02135 [Planctomycetota bacterium]|nr:hypothetical protein [Planctomycetota bacterium]
MRSFVPFILAASLLLTVSARAEDADELAAKGIAALKLSENDGDAVVPAAIYFGQAADLYDASGETRKATDMNSFMYWCKKKMTLAQMDEFLKSGGKVNAALAKRMKELEAAPQPDEAQTFFNRAEAYANAHPAEHLLIAVRFYEVADRFKGTDLSLQAQDRSLKEMTLEKTSAANAGTAARENPIAPPVDPAKKVALPAAAKQKEAEKTIKDLYKDEFAKTAPKDKAALAAKLEKQADESASDPAARYVLLTQAAGLAAQAGELERLTGILDKLAAGFESDFKDFKKAQLSAAMSKITDAKLAKVASALKVLIDKPDDAAANLTLGKYKLQAGDIEHAAAFIAKSKNTALMELMKQEQAAPADSAGQAALGDAWWTLAEKAGDKDDKALFRSRAASWYEKSLESLTGLARTKVEKRVEEMAGISKGKTVDLLKVVNPAKDSVKGGWKIEGGALICNMAAQDGRIRLPATCDTEYDFHAVFKRTSNESGGDIGFFLVHFKQQLLLTLSGYGNSLAGIHKINGSFLKENETRTENSLRNNVPYDLKVQVRRKSIRVLLNDKQLLNYKFEGARFSLHDSWKLPDLKSFGIFCFNCEAQFQTIEFTEVIDAKSPQ